MRITLLQTGEFVIFCRFLRRLNGLVFRRRGLLSLLETAIDTSASRSGGTAEGDDLGSGAHRAIEIVAVVGGDEKHAVSVV